MRTVKQRYWMIEFLTLMTIFCVISVASWLIRPFDINADTVPYWIGGPVCVAIYVTAQTWWHFRSRSGE